MSNVTHYRKVFDSPYLSSADVVEPVSLTISRVTQESDKSKKTKDVFNTVYFVELEIRQGEKLKPMILNATNSKMLAKIAGSPFIEEWSGKRITVYVETGIKFGRDTVDGLRIRPAAARSAVTPDNAKLWTGAKEAFKRDGNLERVLSRADMSEEHISQLITEVKAEQESAKVAE